LMNLLGSHDTNRALFMLDPNTGLNDPSIYEDPDYDWSTALGRLKGVALLQMTMPGAPTLYYGDEVGLVGPVHYDGSTWQDDPYNRQPFPWLDESGTPYYGHLQSGGAGWDGLRPYYQLLTGARNEHPALRTGSFDTLLVDDENDVYVYGRKMADYSDAAVVLINRSATLSQTITIDVSGYLPYGLTLVDALDDDAPYTVGGDGMLTVNVPPLSGALLVTTGAFAAPPDAVSDLAVVAERSEELDLDWSAVAGATSYDVYRSLVTGGGYTFVANTTDTIYTDTGLTNAQRYYYVVVSRDDATGLVSEPSNEATGLPHHDLTTAWYNLQWPPEITHTISTITPTENIYGQLYIAGATGPDGPATGITAQVGYGPVDSDPDEPAWAWETMLYHLPVGNNDEYVGNLLPDMVGEYWYATRWSSDGGESWFYSDLDGPLGPGALWANELTNPGILHVIPSDDLTPPAAPQNLQVTGTTSGSITIAWDANGEPDLAGYEIFRRHVADPDFTRIARVGSEVTTYTDVDVVTNESYEYYVVAYDTSWNRSDPSNIVMATAEPRIVAVTFNVTVPDFTPGTVHIVGNQPEIGNWDPGAVPMTQVGSNQWTITIDFLDGTLLEYKFTRGNWETVEKEADGNTEIPNRQLTVDYGTTGTQIVEHEAANWRDPIVVEHHPPADATGVPVTTTITVTWSQAMPDTTDFTIVGPDGPVAGTFSYDPATFTVTFTPSEPLAQVTEYLVDVRDEVDVAGDVQQVPVQWSFTTEGEPAALVVSNLRASAGGIAVPLVLFGGTLAAGLGLALWRRRRA
ncbi:MAG: Ig-like domain-containing protein, partial [Ardenticatenaceae bacterium]